MNLKYKSHKENRFLGCDPTDSFEEIYIFLEGFDFNNCVCLSHHKGVNFSFLLPFYHETIYMNKDYR